MVAVLALTALLGPVPSAIELNVEAQQPETLSLLGAPLFPPRLSREERAAADAAMRTAHAQYMKTPNDVAAIVALADAHVAFGRVGDAIEIVTRGLEVNADEPRLLANRASGFILLRKFDLAQRDARNAIEKVPSAHCTLGFSQYLAGAFPHAQASYAKCADPGIFGYLSARRAGATATRPEVGSETMKAEQDIRLPGSTTPKRTKAQVSLGAAYAAAAELLIEGKNEEATDRLKAIVEKNRNEWMDPSYIAAEADYARLNRPARRKQAPSYPSPSLVSCVSTSGAR
jgi:tetratricopeptide (TPR) repeat protein